MNKTRVCEKRTDPFGVAAIQTVSDRSLPPEFREENERSVRESRVAELKRQYQAGNYNVPALEISAAVIEKHLKR